MHMAVSAALDQEREFLHGLGSEDAGASPAECAIWTDNLTKHYKAAPWKKTVSALESLQLRIRPGEIFGFLGPNGAGKTTTIKLLTGLILPTRGRAFVGGLPANSRRARARVGFLPENPAFTGSWKAAEFLKLSALLAGMRAREAGREVDRLVSRLGLEPVRDRHLRGLSKGYLQLVGIAQALLGSPPLLILDEPMSGLDPIGRRMVRDLLFDMRDRGRTVFLSSHILSDVELLCDRVGILRRGRLETVCSRGEIEVSQPAERELVVRGIVTREIPLLVPEATAVRHLDDRVVIGLRGTEPVDEVLRRLLKRGVEIVSLARRGGGLEQFVLDRLRDSPRSSGRVVQEENRASPDEVAPPPAARGEG